MTKYVLKRLVLMFFTFFVIVTMCFFLIRLLPRELPMDANLKKIILARFEALGYNKPLIVQYGIYWRNILVWITLAVVHVEGDSSIFDIGH